MARASAQKVGARAAAGAIAEKRRAGGFNWFLLTMFIATLVLLVLLIPVGSLFYSAYLRPLLGRPPVTTPVGAAPSAVAVAPTGTATSTPTPTPTKQPTATPSPTVTPTPRYPAWMQFVVVDKKRREIRDDRHNLSEVRGKILDRNGNLVPGLRLIIQSYGGWAAERPRPDIDVADGTFRFDQLSRGRYKVTIVDKDGHPLSQTAEDLVTDDLPENFKGYVIWEVTFKVAE